MTELRVAIIGEDAAGEAWLRSDPDLQALTDPSQADAIVVLGEGAAQAEALALALLHGVPVLLHRLPTEARVAELARGAGAPVHYWWAHRLIPTLTGLRKEIYAGKIGLPTDLTIQFWLPAPAGSDADPTPLLAAAADVAAWLTGCGPRSVYTSATLRDGPVCLATAALVLKGDVPVALTAGWAWGLSSAGGPEPSVRVMAVGTHGLMNVSTDRPAYLLTDSDGHTQSVVMGRDSTRRPGREIGALLAHPTSPAQAASDLARTVACLKALRLSVETDSVQMISEP